MKELNPSFVGCLLMLLLLLPHVSHSDFASLIQPICRDKLERNTTSFVPSLDGVFDSISKQITNQGWGLFANGLAPDVVYGLAQCYGYLSLHDCVLCYAEARTVLPECFPYNGGRIYLDGCFMRVENYTFFQEVLGPEDRHICENSTRKDSVFGETVRRAVLQAVSNVSNNTEYAKVELPVSGRKNETVYVVANCWKTVDNCRECLGNASRSMLQCLPSSEGRALYTGCFMRYSGINFLDPIISNGGLNRTYGDLNRTNGGLSRGKVIIIIVAVVCSVIVLILIALYIKLKRIHNTKGPNAAQKLAMMLHDSSLNFKYSVLEKATGSFDEANKLGQGGFGSVYKGVLPDGREVAIKKLLFNTTKRAEDFYNEVNIISSIEHKNLVKLLGCSFSGPESLLVYELLPNKSLDQFIFDPEKGKILNWNKRFNIITRIAEGLIYLHGNSTKRIIHRDIKASNILLDSRLHAKIADFGLARSFQADKSHISTAIAGTLGYMAPEYVARGQLTEKADVYSFGVLLLEIVARRQNNKCTTPEYSGSLVNIVWVHFQQGAVEELFDPNLMLHNCGNSVRSEASRAVHVGLLCTQEIPSRRPYMSKALEMLMKKEEHLPTPSKPAFTYEKSIELCEAAGLREGDAATNATISQSSFYPR
ncbi:cysteine-rich receptor-like protein kinase 2 isoform X1 [Ipomoea triloba]|uniref:cysteine-rich receptor-like protein kinase 2 isoform X1 n=2 Tax=Ipomoea triloba TaxID=35885 RepID=UPI00125E0574|nr:cysteine-rich receptor-like protein kinase 2 isoform X1 [Ipomoea triloba]XP_031100245.1 cysteine-rich receptor-like protein kinase 2 isoform X1 [Ipomoea triloba]XP_031100247.1 cysteine-rich receptor-like protein kinase 2 isoform X1 [Ipomoea triloba]